MVMETWHSIRKLLDVCFSGLTEIYLKQPKDFSIKPENSRGKQRKHSHQQELSEKDSSSWGNNLRTEKCDCVELKQLLGLEDGSVGKALGTKPDNLSLIPRTHMVEGDNRSLQVI